ncbi:MAG: hydrogenase maturation protease [Nitrospinae bacterium]|nr:hydrogenase maturation protease [Nitrospinota bacterium]
MDLQDPAAKKILVYGYGNPGREDDGLGPLFIDSLEKSECPLESRIELHSSYQLNIEDALLVSGKDLVVFVDASREDIDGFSFREVQASSRMSFFTHGLDAGDVLGLARKLYNRRPAAYLLGIKGYSWGPVESLTPGAQENLQKALSFLLRELAV